MIRKSLIKFLALGFSNLHGLLINCNAIPDLFYIENTLSYT